MDRLLRVTRLDRLLRDRRTPLARSVIEREIECDRTTAKRMIDELRNLGAPIEYDRERNGYYYGNDGRGHDGRKFELPGLWFTPKELYALLIAHELLRGTDDGALVDALGPLRRRTEQLLAAEHLGGGELLRRVRILRMASRGIGPAFVEVAAALAERRRLRIRYRSRTSDEEALREVSPQRLVHYRDNWYLDAWCHWRGGLRSFAVERIAHVTRLARRARNLPESALDRELGSSYGIFAGEPRAQAVLRFSAERARWVAAEDWHPRQQGRALEDGRYELSFPYSDPRELVGDILRHGAHVEVLAPAELRAQVASALQAASALYSGGRTV